jgi:cytochrome P450
VTLTNPTIEDLIRSPELAVDPFPAYRRLLADAPVWIAAGGTKVFSRHTTCQRILRDADRFGQIATQHKKPSFFGMNRPDHTRIRSLVAQAFTVPAIARLQGEVQGRADELMSTLRPRGHMDMVTELARPLAAYMITKMTGIPLEDSELWEQWADAIHHAIGLIGLLPEQQEHQMMMMAAAQEASEQEAEYFRRVIAQRRSSPRREDLLATMMDAEEAGDRLTDEELRYTLVLILGAGHHTTVNLMANTVLSLMRNPDQLALVQADRSLVPSAIDETARMEGVLQFTQRLVREDAEIEGVSVHAGEVIQLCLGAANHDPEVFSDPWTFDVRRENLSRHLGFGHGIHHCLGRNLGVAEATVAVNTVLDLPDLAVKPFEYEGMAVLRGPVHLPLRWSTRA